MSSLFTQPSKPTHELEYVQIRILTLKSHEKCVIHSPQHHTHLHV